MSFEEFGADFIRGVLDLPQLPQLLAPNTEAILEVEPEHDRFICCKDDDDLPIWEAILPTWFIEKAGGHIEGEEGRLKLGVVVFLKQMRESEAMSGKRKRSSYQL